MEVLQSRPSLISLIKTVTEEHGINEYLLSDVKTNPKGEGYLGEIFLITAKDANSDQRLEIVIKSAFQEANIREMVPIRISFENEILFYTEVYPAFEKFAQERGISNSAALVPKCLHASSEENDEALVLENMKASGFEVFDKKLLLDEEHVKMIFQTYGRFHAYSFALRDQKPEEFARITENMCNVYAEFMQNEIFSNFMVENHKFVQNAFVPEEDEEIIKKYESCYSGVKILEIFEDIVTEDFDYFGILHGDCWSNNMMFKYEGTGNGKKPIDMRLLDLQLVKIGSPVCDLSYCLYSGASKKIFDNLNDYLQIYYDSFSSFVKELGSDPEKLFPFSVLKEHWRKYSKFGMIMALSIIKMKLTVQEDLINFTDGDNMQEITDIFMKQRFDEEGYQKRIRGLLWHMAELGAL